MPWQGLYTVKYDDGTMETRVKGFHIRRVGGASASPVVSTVHDAESTAAPLSAVASLLSYVCPEKGAPHGKARVGFEAGRGTEFGGWCRCNACMRFVAELNNEIAARGLPSREDISRDMKLLALRLNEEAVPLRLADGTALNELFATQHRNSARLKQECAKLGLLVDVSATKIKIFEVLVHGVQAQAAAAARQAKLAHLDTLAGGEVSVEAGGEAIGEAGGEAGGVLKSISSPYILFCRAVSRTCIFERAPHLT